MDAKELKRLGKRELMELLLEQTKRADALQKELDETKACLEDRSIKISNAGSIAEASLALNDIFRITQGVADEYLENVKRLNDETDEICKDKIAKATEESEAMVAEATATSEAMVAEATEKSETMVKEAAMKADAVMKHAKTETEEYWKDVKAKLDAYLEAHQSLKEILGFMK